MAPDGGVGTRVKLWTTHVTMAAFFLAGGIEYSVIFPTMWDYLQGLGGEEWLYGLSLAAFSISNLVTGPLYGLVFDLTGKTKFILLFANLFEIGGNFMYFSATSKYILLGSRFIVGVGAGAGATIFGELARISTKKERTSIFSVFTTVRQIGLILGPAFNFPLRILDVKIGPFILNKYTAPGALMMVIWIVLELMFLLMFYHLPSAKEEREEGAEGSKASSSSDQTSTERAQGTAKDFPSDDECSSVSDSEEATEAVFKDGSKKAEPNRDHTRDNMRHPQVQSSSDGKHSDSMQLEHNETTPLLSSRKTPTLYSVNKDVDTSVHKSVESREMSVGQGSGIFSICDVLQSGLKYVLFVASELLKEEIVVLLSILAVTVFNQTAIETMLVPMAEDLLGWTERDTSIFYSAAGVEIIVAVVVVMVLSRWIGDRWQLFLGLLLNLFGYSWLIAFVGAGKSGTYILLKFIVGSVPIIFGLPFFAVTGASLYSKFLPLKVQGVGQGIRRSIFSISAILGPLWAGGAVAFDTYYILFGVPLGLLVLVMILIMLSFSRLKEQRELPLLLS